MDEGATADSLPPVLKKNSRNETCPDCHEEFESVFLAPKIGTLGIWTSEARDGRCVRCDAQFRKAAIDQRLERDRREKENRRKREAVAILGGVKPFEEYTFERFDRSRAEGAEKAYAAAMAFDPERDNLFFFGKSNLGKTHLATAVAHKFIDMNSTVRFYEMPELIETLRIYEKNRDLERVKKLITRCSEATVWVLDDLGVVGCTQYVIQVLWQILTKRINNRRNGAIITSNDSLNELAAKYEPKIPHRIHRLCGTAHEIRFGAAPQ